MMGILLVMRLSTYLKKHGLDEGEFAALSQGQFSPEAVRKWRFGVRVPRPKHMAAIAAITGGAVTANDFMSVPAQPDQALAS